MARTFYRIVETNPPTAADFLSDVARGRVPRQMAAAEARLRSGLSMFRTEAQARRRARMYPWIGAYIAAVRIPDDSPARIERTLRRSPGHHTVWGEPTELLGYVVAVVPV